MSLFDQLSAEIGFCRVYSKQLLVIQTVAVVLFTAVTQDISKFGRSLTSPVGLTVQLAYISLAVVLACRRSGLSKCKFRQNSWVLNTSNSGSKRVIDYTKGTLLRRTVQRIKYYGTRLAPVVTFCKATVSLIIATIFILYISFCFGAPLNFPPFGSDDFEETTLSFALLVAIHVALPVLVVYGCDSLASGYTHVYLERGRNIDKVSPVAQVLFVNGVGACVGAWFGAFPIPLDWDRPWQAWPITCAIGCVVGATIAYIYSFVKFQSTSKPSLIGSKSKYQ